MMGRTRTVGIAAVLTTAAIGWIGGAALAKPLDHGEFHDEFSELVPSFCDVAGLTVQVDGVVDGRFLDTAVRGGTTSSTSKSTCASLSRSPT